MPNPSATPTPITPPRVPLIDQRTGLIDRSWYMFFVSLFQLANTAETADTGTNVNSLLASYDAALQTLAQATETQPATSIAELQATLDSVRQELQTLPPPREFKRARYGQFFDTTTQTAAVINTAYGITFNNTDISDGVYVGSPTSRIYVDEPSIYNFLFSIQLDKTSGGTANFWVWPRINGVDVPNTASQVRIQGNDAEIFTSVGFFFELAAGDYVEFMFEVSDTSVELAYFPASAVHPAIPSIILTVTDNIQGVQ
jgi:hypothetical protein